jgi:hypothetical protein
MSGLSATAVLAALERQYSKPDGSRDGEILIPEVQAPGSTRRADLVRVGMWASRGTGVDVHEVKVSRADWLRELDDPGKAEAWWPYCNRFWVAALPGVVGEGELPAGWGLMELPRSGRRFSVRVPAETRKDVRLTVPLLIELLRRADNQRLAEMDRMRLRHQEDMRKLADDWRKKAEGETSLEAALRLGLLDDIEKALGVPLAQYPGWPRLPPSAVTPEELAAFLADAREHVTAQRRSAAVGRQADGLRGAAERALKELAKLAEGSDPKAGTVPATGTAP